MGRSQLTLAAVLAAATIAAPSRAQTAEDKAAADAAFDQGRRLMAAHSYAEACGKFAESLRRDPGIGTMLGLADCYEKNGQTASAWAQFREAAAAAARKHDAREALARENVDRLAPLLSKLVVHVPADADVRGLVVKRDGVEVGRALWDAPVPLDPGVHTLSAAAPGKREWQTNVTIARTAGVQTVTVPVLDAAPVSVAPPAPAMTTTAPAMATTAADPHAGRTQRIVAVAALGAGVAGAAVGTIFGLRAKGKLDDSNANGHCGAADDCDATGLALRSDARSAATVSTIAFVVGGAAIAGGVVLWLTAPSPRGAEARSSRARVGLAPSPGGASFVGAW